MAKGPNGDLSVLSMTPQGLRLTVKVVPGATRTRIVGLHGDALKVQVAAAPEQGKANQAVTRLLSDALEIPVRDIRLISGSTHPRKMFAIDGLGLKTAAQRLGISL